MGAGIALTVGGNKPGFAAAGTGNTAQGLSIFARGDLGPDDGATANDANDPDTSPGFVQVNTTAANTVGSPPSSRPHW